MRNINLVNCLFKIPYKVTVFLPIKLRVNPQKNNSVFPMMFEHLNDRTFVISKVDKNNSSESLNKEI